MSPLPASSSHPRVALINLGCTKNTVDSECALGDLLDHGFELAADPEEADLVLINTCGFIQDAREEGIEEILAAVALKESAPRLKVAAMGCLAERYGQEIFDEIPELDGVLGLGAYARLEGYCRSILRGKRVLALGNASATLTERPRLVSTGEQFAYLRIADGCDNRCSYCAVPLIRGGYRSRGFRHIVDEARALAEQGYLELNLIAQDITRYGQDIGGRTLADLLRELLTIPEKPWLRLLYAHPVSLTDEVIDLLGSEPQLLRYLDLPIQHINSRVLKQMRRHVDRHDIERLLKRLHAIPDMVLRTSIICGFPGETEEEFDELLAFVREGHFQQLGAFAFSPEEDTPAYTMEGQLPDEVRAERRDRVMEAQQEVTFRWLDSRIGQTTDMILLGQDEEGRLWGRTRAEAPDVDGVVYLADDQQLPESAYFPACLTERIGYDLVAVSKTLPSR